LCCILCESVLNFSGSLNISRQFFSCHRQIFHVNQASVLYAHLIIKITIIILQACFCKIDSHQNGLNHNLRFIHSLKSRSCLFCNSLHDHFYKYSLKFFELRGRFIATADGNGFVGAKSLMSTRAACGKPIIKSKSVKPEPNNSF